MVVVLRSVLWGRRASPGRRLVCVQHTVYYQFVYITWNIFFENARMRRAGVIMVCLAEMVRSSSNMVL